MSVFQFDNYKLYVNARIKEMPKKGRGEFQRLATVLQMHTTSISQVFKGEKHLTLEQAARLCAQWGLNRNESNYFLTLVELERAGSPELKQILGDRLEELKATSHQLKHRIPKDHVLKESDRYRFYSEWYYSAIRLLCDIPHFRSVDRIAIHLRLPIATVNDAIQFLLAAGLISEEKGQMKLGPSRTYLEATSPLVARHHANWRLKAVERYSNVKHDRDLVVTSPMTVSAGDAKVIRETLLKTIEKILEINTTSPSEGLHVLNIDWLSI